MIICPRLPLELLYLVVHKSDRRTLAVLLRTSRALSREAKPLFFASISIASTATLASLLRAHAHGRLQPSWPRRLHLIYPPAQLPSFANVTSVRWTFSPFNARTFLPYTLRDALSSFPSLVALALHEGPRTSHELSVVLSLVAHTLQTLELAFCASFAVSPSTIAVQFPALRDLLFADGHACDVGALFMTFGAIPPIEVLRIPAFCSWETLRDILRLVAPTLRTLDVDVMTSVEMYTNMYAPCSAKGMDRRMWIGQGGAASL
ncbi:uncharacterized protein SCHCODRAFT_02502021 [Schizophyllum commune H4-8]|uniref:uncharacterized protein n=1 Tax=Schizophyllum commune (strain H4-8 / FGSC 9210) TaxID=578458 RepID=UPI00215E490B|nr:uncharacterized protein SCHCODRAFT_02502021 [Schizophyllum commune H4-8]KAI5892464.1 hypothetical protein SCHCODRAFT_02502021 [Schizophyllum commune H4-8]